MVYTGNWRKNLGQHINVPSIKISLIWSERHFRFVTHVKITMPVSLEFLAKKHLSLFVFKSRTSRASWTSPLFLGYFGRSLRRSQYSDCARFFKSFVSSKFSSWICISWRMILLGREVMSRIVSLYVREVVSLQPFSRHFHDYVHFSFSRLQLLFAITCHPSVVRHKLSHLNLLLWNPWTKLNQTWQGGSLSQLCPTVPPSIQDGCCY
jgi:hypothetical protein